VKIQAIINIDIDAADAVEVRAHKLRLAELLAQLKPEYREARLQVKARRPRLAARAAPPPKLGGEFEIVRARFVG
jgi:hypothetical protein